MKKLILLIVLLCTTLLSFSQSIKDRFIFLNDEPIGKIVKEYRTISTFSDIINYNIASYNRNNDDLIKQLIEAYHEKKYVTDNYIPIIKINIFFYDFRKNITLKHNVILNDTIYYDNKIYGKIDTAYYNDANYSVKLYKVKSFNKDYNNQIYDVISEYDANTNPYNTILKIQFIDDTLSYLTNNSNISANNLIEAGRLYNQRTTVWIVGNLLGGIVATASATSQSTSGIIVGGVIIIVSNIIAIVSDYNGNEELIKAGINLKK